MKKAVDESIRNTINMLKNILETKLRNTFSPTYLKVKDDSYLHVSHGNYEPGGGSHLSIIIISSVFCGLSRIQRHQQVYACLEDEIKNGVHALSLKTLCPKEAGESAEFE